VQDVTAESLSLTRAQRMNRNAVGTFYNMLEKVATENKFCDTPGNILNINGSGKQMNNKSDSVRTERGSKMFMF
jgi:hypothetical protein